MRVYALRLTRVISQTPVIQHRKETMEMKYTYTTQYTVQQVCDILDIQLPAEYQSIAGDVLTNISYRQTHFITEGGAFS